MIRFKTWQKIFGVCMLLFFIAFGFASPVFASHPQREFPKRANYFLKWTLTEADVHELAKWDVVILDMEVQVRQPEMLKKIRQLNPHITLLAYITAQEIRGDASTSYSLMRRKLVSGISDAWYLKGSAGHTLSWWPGTYLLNITNEAPSIQGQRLNTYIASFAATDIMGSGLWDGIFYDNAWDNITYFAKTQDIDLNGDGSADGNLDHAWREGMKTLYRETRRLAGRPIILVGNGLTQVYKEELNGNMFENFHNFSWAEFMGAYKKGNEGPYRVNIMNANTDNTGMESDYQRVRYGVTSALLENGYYSFDYGDTKHEQTWWYDEYAADLGPALGSSVSQKELRSYQPDVWRRDFEHGVAVVNSTGGAQTVSLGGEYEALHGMRETTVNNGRIVSEVEVAAEDGRILLKTFEKLKDIVFTNGNFVRFLRKNGSRVRNGIFVFDPAYKGGDMIMNTDVNGDGERDTILISDDQLSVIRSDGQNYFTLFPFTANYTGTMRLAVGDLVGDKEAEIVVAPSEGQNQPIKIYNLKGEQVYADWFPFGKKYTGGYSVSVGALDAKRPKRIVIGNGKGFEPAVTIFTSELKKEKTFLVYEKKFKGGLRVALGDVTSDGVAEIVVAPASQKKPLVAIFDAKGKSVQKQFAAFTTFGSAEVELLQLSDVDFDGVKDVLVFTKNIGI